MKHNLTKDEANLLAEKIRKEQPTMNDTMILSAFRYHFPLFLWGIENAEQFINAMLIAAFNGASNSIVNIIGLERSLEIGSPMISLDTSYGPQKFKIETDHTPNETTSFE